MTASPRQPEPAGHGGPATSASRPTRLTRRAAVLGALVLGGATLVAGSAVWVRATTSSAVDVQVPLAVAGGVVAPGVQAGGLVVLAAGGALALGGRVGRRLAGAGVVLGGVLVAAAAVGGLRDPGAAALSAAREAVGVAQLTSPVVTTAAPWLAVALGAAAVGLGAWSLAVSGSWPGGDGRHERAVDERRVADEQRAARDDRPARDERAVGAEPATGEEHAGDDQSTWDSLTRGHDPT